MITTSFAICLIISIGLLAYVVAKNYENISVYSWTILILIPVIILGYWLKSRVTTPEAAYMAFCFIYLDNSVLLVTALFTMLHALGVEANIRAKLAFYALACAHVFLVWGSFGTDLYYSSIEVVQTPLGSATLVTGGPFKILHNVYLVVTVAIIVLTIAAYYFKKGTYSRIVLYNFTMVGFAFVAAYVAELIVNTGFSFMPYMYVFADIIVATTYDQMHMHDIACVLSQHQKYHAKKGFVAVSYRHNFMSCNEKAYEFLPYLKGQRVDKGFSQDHPLFDEMINQYEEDSSAFRKVQVGDLTLAFEISETSMRRDGKNQGYLFEVRDVTEDQAVLDALSVYNENLTDELELKASYVIEIQQKITMGMANMIENRDSNTGGHVKRTSDVIRILMDEIVSRDNAGISLRMAGNIVRAAPLHDLGKINIDSSILCKPGKLTDEEFAIIKTHSAKSGEIVRILLDGVEEKDFVDTAFNIARYHHERWDGRGYPDGLAGTQIPVEARIMAVADVYDALVSKRCYKEPMGFDRATAIMREGMGSQFDPGLEVIFEACRPKLEEYYRSSRDDGDE